MEGELSVSGSKAWPSVSGLAGGSSKLRTQTWPPHSGLETCSAGDLGESIFSEVLGQKPDGMPRFYRESWGKT